MSGGPALRLFEALGVELEYMIVDRETLSVRPVADAVLASVGGEGETEVEIDGLAWSNELALHVIELKTNGPSPSLDGLSGQFHDSVRRIDDILRPLNARLMPTAMHPWMDPATELCLWPHEAGPIYQAFHRIFDCRGHGWANLQSVHVNLPFGDDDEFGRLHAAIRMVLPILPALAASSPVADGALTGFLDTRMEYYRHNAARVPSVSGRIVPERVYTRADYEGGLLGGIYDDLAPLDPEGILRHEWVNARGCIARFDRGAIEIRVLDVQECPAADLAVCAATTAVVRALTDGRVGEPERIREWSEETLGAIFVDTLRDADRTALGDGEYLRALGFPGKAPATAGELWSHLVDSVVAREPGYDAWAPALDVLLRDGCLARRIAGHLGTGFSRERLAQVYRELCDCLAGNRLLTAP